jgi:hypothetical protein
MRSISGIALRDLGGRRLLGDGGGRDQHQEQAGEQLQHLLVLSPNLSGARNQRQEASLSPPMSDFDHDCLVIGGGPPALPPQSTWSASTSR